MNLGFSPQQLIAVIIEDFIKKYVPGGELLASAVGSVIKGTHEVDESLEESAREKISEVSSDIAGDTRFEAEINLGELIGSDKLQQHKFISLIFSDKAKELLCTELFSHVSKLDGCDVTTYPFEKLAEAIIDKFKDAVYADFQFADFANKVKTFSEQPIYCANWMYVNSFITPMFLHKNGDKYDPRVCLKNLYVMPKCKKETDNGFENSVLADEISAFLNNDGEKFLFIEGDAGTGKTTLAAWLNYHYALKDETAEKLFGDRPLLTVRLRDLKKETIKSDGLCAAVAKYTKAESLSALETLYPEAVIILDGFDELCMIMKSESEDNIFTDLSDLESFQYIITSRHKYIDYTKIEHYKLLMLLHFDTELREEWLKNYKGREKCGQTVLKEIEDYILANENPEASNNDDWNICSTPMTLYMICAKDEVRDCLGNMWQLYNRIFKKELSKTEYNKMFPNPQSRTHGIDKVIDELYRISEEIAYKMYMGGNAQLYVSRDDVSEIIGKLKIEKSDERELLKQCYALCCYWKADSFDGAAEFLHNDIRDFFLAEKIYREAERIINSDLSVDEAAIELCRLFQYGALEDKVCEFIYLRAKYNKENNNSDFASALYRRERDKQPGRYSDIILSICKQGLANSGVLIPDRDISDTIKNILRACVQIFKKIFEVHRDKSDKNDVINWSRKTASMENNNCLGDDHTFLSFFDEVIRQNGDFGNFCYMNLSSHNLSDYGFSNSIFEGAHLSFAHLSFAHLNDAHLERAHLEGAHLEGAHLEDANLRGAHLEGAHLERAHLERAHLEDANLRVAHLERAHLEDAHLREADLEYASLERADLRDAHLEDARLEGAHLERADLEGAHLSFAHLEDARLELANLERADLEGANLERADLERARLRDAHLELANLERADLEGANLERADLEGARLRDAHLEWATLPDGFRSGSQEEQVQHLKSLNISGLII